MRIDDILGLEQKCTGCMACVDACPTKCISPIESESGFRYSLLDSDKCINCGKCYSVCPIETTRKCNEEQHLFAAYAIDAVARNKGSSGGMFELLAKYFLENGYYVCGAAFDGLKLRHLVASSAEELPPLLKSKYIQSDTTGIYKKILELLKNGERVFFCGTPCQVSALVNTVPQQNRSNLFTADIICHGVPSQKSFDGYIETLRVKHKGEISDFSFRVKDNRFKHAHGYSYRVTKDDKSFWVNGIYSDSSFYNAFKQYLFFRNSCYDCQYATLERVSDITLADFWGIEKYDFKANTDAGVSMIITNTQNGLDAFSAVREKTVSKEFPVTCGVESNYCLTHTTKKPKNRDEIIAYMAENGYSKTANKYFGCSFKHKIYWLIPSKMRTLIRKIRGN